MDNVGYTQLKVDIENAKTFETVFHRYMSQTTCLINEVLSNLEILKITQAISITLKASRHIFKHFVW